MSDLAVAGEFRPVHGGLQRPGAKRRVQHLELPPWHGWRWTSESKRIVRWIEGTLVQPIGVGAGQPMRVAAFQRRLLERMCESLATFISIPAGNGKTTLMAAVALERLCRGDDYVEVDVLATKEDQARRLVQASIQMIECCPPLVDLFEFYRDAAVLEYRPTGSRMTAHPAKLSAIQGLNSTLALVDEIAEVPAELVTSMVARLGKREAQRVIGFGTPGFGPANMLETLRLMAHAGELPPGVGFVEYAADPGCSIDDVEQWRKANPAIEAGFLDPASLPLKAAIMPEHEFRAYHLGQPVDSSGPWLPFGAWDACFLQSAPADGASVVLSLWGNYRRQVAIVGATLDGGLFFGWQSEKPSDDEIAAVVAQAADQWEIVEIVAKPHLRIGLVQRLEDDGMPVKAWPHDVATDVESTAAFYQAVAEQTLAHDHDEFLAEQMGLLTAKVDRHGNPRMVDSSEVDVSAALAARAAWWRARQLADAEPEGEVTVY